VEIAREGIAKRPAKLLHEDEIEIADEHDRRGHVVHETGAAAQIDDHASQRFVHRQEKEAVAADAGLGAERLLERLAEHEPDILDRVVIIDGDIAFRGNLQIEQAMLRKQREHVIEKRDARIDLGRATAVHRQRQPDVGLGGRARDRCYARGAALSHESIFWLRACISSSVPTLMRRKEAVKAWLAK